MGHVSNSSPRDLFLGAVATADLSVSMPGPMEPMPAEDMIGRFICNDVLVHTFDLAHAVGGDERLEPAAVEGAYSGLKPLDAMIRHPGVFSPQPRPPRAPTCRRSSCASSAARPEHRSMSDSASITRDIAAPADTVWEMVSISSGWASGHPERGWRVDQGRHRSRRRRRLPGANRNGSKSWKTVATVTAADPGRRFAFRVGVIGLRVADWSFDIEPTDSGCRVTQSFTDLRAGFFKPIAKMATGVADRVTHNRAAMETTLERLAAAAEATA